MWARAITAATILAAATIATITIAATTTTTTITTTTIATTIAATTTHLLLRLDHDRVAVRIQSYLSPVDSLRERRALTLRRKFLALHRRLGAPPWRLGAHCRIGATSGCLLLKTGSAALNRRLNLLAGYLRPAGRTGLVSREARLVAHQICRDVHGALQHCVRDGFTLLGALQLRRRGRGTTSITRAAVPAVVTAACPGTCHPPCRTRCVDAAAVAAPSALNAQLPHCIRWLPVGIVRHIARRAHSHRFGWHGGAPVELFERAPFAEIDLQLHVRRHLRVHQVGNLSVEGDADEAATHGSSGTREPDSAERRGEGYGCRVVGAE